MEILGWWIIGALIGYAASQKKGFSPVGGVLGGMWLGPLAFLMFMVSGVTKEDANRKKCPHCAEWVKGDAKICKHCHQSLVSAPPRRTVPPPIPRA